MDILSKIGIIDKLDFEEQYDLVKKISYLLNSNKASDQLSGRNYLIRVIDVWEKVPCAIKIIWEDLIESAGFYPYIEKYKMDILDLDARIRQEFHRSNYISDKILHLKQKELSEIILAKKNVVVSAPTSFGKSLLIEELIASNIYNNIVIIQPTLALLEETRLKLRKYSDKYKIIVRTSQDYSKEKGNIFLLTAERVLEYQNMPGIDLLVIDEFYKLSKQRNDNRANILNIAFLRIMKNDNCRFYLLGPNINNISSGFIDKYDAIFFKTDYTMVSTETIDLYKDAKTKKSGKIDDEYIFDVLDKLDDQSLIFCSSPSSARKLAFAYCSHLENKGIFKNVDIPLIEWIHQNLSVEWSLAHCLANEIGIHDGSMPKHITTSTINYFNNQQIKYLFCTNTIIEGVNTSAKNVVYYDNKIGSKAVDYFDYSNIKGRAGRLMEHCVGNIINLKCPPEIHNMEVDIPAYTQNPIDDEVLINIEKKDVKDINIKRYMKLEEIPADLREVLVRNAVSIKDQLELIPIIKSIMLNPSTKEDIVWSSVRDNRMYYHLKTIFDLVKDRFIEGNEKNVLLTTGWMASQTTSYLYNKDIKKMIEDRVIYLSKQYLKKNIQNYNENEFDLKGFFCQYPLVARKISDESIETIFKFQKNWLQYKIPKWLNIIDSLQKYVAKELNIESGDYSFVAEAIENEFATTNVQILAEYGIPNSAISKILTKFGHHLVGLTEDEVINAVIRNKELIKKYLISYEIDALDRSL